LSNLLTQSTGRNFLGRLFQWNFSMAKGLGHSASAVCQVTPSEQGVPVHYTSRGCLFQERPTP
jgi:hypothetical protein